MVVNELINKLANKLVSKLINRSVSPMVVGAETLLLKCGRFGGFSEENGEQLTNVQSHPPATFEAEYHFASARTSQTNGLY